MFISVQEITQSGMTYDQISTAASVFFCIFYALACQLKLVILLFQERKMKIFIIPRKKNDIKTDIKLFY